jgi:hypothetical protein
MKIHTTVVTADSPWPKKCGIGIGIGIGSPVNLDTTPHSAHSQSPAVFPRTLP